ncbi:MAG TPA: hypothetical protein VJ453_10645 [Terriglobales bacterium]|nr:hypothetical protein [Terriglobales bacterium]
MRCQQCGYSNPGDHKFCGMCGAKVQQEVSPVAIDDSDPLGLQASSFEGRSRIVTDDADTFWERDQRRESIREAARNTDGKDRARGTSAAVQNRPPDTAEEEVEQELQRERESSRASVGIGGPSFLGLGYENAGNSGFVYDKPRNDGFIYDTDGVAPEYLLEDAPRGVSWRALALLALLLVAAGLGYVQWRASHHQGPDISAILARNGATLDATAPVVDNKTAKPAPKANTSAAEPDKADPGKEDAQAKSDSENPENNDKNASPLEAKGAKSPLTSESTEAKGANAKATADKTNDDERTASDSENAEAASVAKSKPNDGNDGNEAAKPESDGPVTKSTKATRARPAPVDEEPAQPKSLGDKDPLIMQAEKYIQGRGVRQNCSAGVNLLRQASSAGNPTADVKMGALYWSGTCVTQSNVTAYQWFSRAHSLEPHNRWVERSRSSLWASMTPDEKRRVAY